jgi:hypothetical protein
MPCIVFCRGICLSVDSGRRSVSSTDRGYSVHLSMLWVGTCLTCPIPAVVSFKSVNGLCCKGSAESDHAPDRDMSHLTIRILCWENLPFCCRYGEICLICTCFVGGSVSSAHAVLWDLSHLFMLFWGICLICQCFIGGFLSSVNALLGDLSHL